MDVKLRNLKERKNYIEIEIFDKFKIAPECITVLPVHGLNFAWYSVNFIINLTFFTLETYKSPLDNIKKIAYLESIIRIWPEVLQCVFETAIF